MGEEKSCIGQIKGIVKLLDLWILMRQVRDYWFTIQNRPHKYEK